MKTGTKSERGSRAHVQALPQHQVRSARPRRVRPCRAAGVGGLNTPGKMARTSGGATPEHLTIAVGENGGTIKTTNNDDKVKVCAGIVKAGSTGGAYTLENPSGNGRASMRFILATGGSTADNLVPLLVSEAYRTIRTGAVISVR